ncbi:hypothetical protein [Lactiplantibacillus plantarum]|uniref:hypothetical protein n=1 Tax=Lactiplantibacillus plantarum TaxID=1590 RepID=UPI00073D5C61|nr:hypothetical protein [Lactiplantibacillus plantarum]AYA96395.1 hypothetical protein CFM86_05830 [Lactiplantibacillus plantarum]AYG35279.1 hypothetical protein CFI98_11025 [Lactiplantibacillus plantarum]
MSRMIHSKYGYEPPEWIQADARLDRWYKDKKRRANKHGAFCLENKAKAVFRLHRVMDLNWKIKVNSKPVDFDWFKNGGNRK